MMHLLSALSVFDWVSPLVGTIQDVTWFVTGGERADTLWASKYEIVEAQRILSKAGIRVISWTQVAFDDEGGIDVPHSQVGLAKLLLANEGVDTW